MRAFYGYLFIAVFALGASAAPSCTSGICCDNGTVRPFAHVCAVGSNECTATAAYCDGATPFCPMLQIMEDGTKCNGIGKCKNGDCYILGIKVEGFKDPRAQHEADVKKMKEMNKQITETNLKHNYKVEGADPKKVYIPYDEFGLVRPSAKNPTSPGNGGSGSSKIRDNELASIPMGTASRFLGFGVSTVPDKVVMPIASSSHPSMDKLKAREEKLALDAAQAGKSSEKARNKLPSIIETVSRSIAAHSSSKKESGAKSVSDNKSNSGTSRQQINSFGVNSANSLIIGQIRNNSQIRGQVRSNSGQIRSNGGQIRSNGGQILNNGGQIRSNGGQILNNGGQILNNGGQIRSNSGKIPSNGGKIPSNPKIDPSATNGPNSGTTSRDTKNAEHGELNNVFENSEAKDVASPGVEFSILSSAPQSAALSLCSMGPGVLSPQGTVCERSTSECRGDAICSGDSTVCPEAPVMPDGTPCMLGTGSCLGGVCNARVCYGDCCGADMNLAPESTACGFDMRGKCNGYGVCMINEEFTPEYAQKQELKRQKFHVSLSKLLSTNEQYSTKKAIR